MPLQHTTGHPILGCAQLLETTLGEVAAMPADYLRTRDKEETLIALARVEARLVELKARLHRCGCGRGARRPGSRDVAGPRHPDHRVGCPVRAAVR